MQRASVIWSTLLDTSVREWEDAKCNRRRFQLLEEEDTRERVGVTEP